MFKDFFAKSPLLALPILSLAVFLTTFLCVVVFVVARASSRRTWRVGARSRGGS